MTNAADITTAAKTLTNATHAIALVGAGMSVESGIPPFRGTGGLWTKRGEPAMDGYQRFVEDIRGSWEAMLARRANPPDDEFAVALANAVPNDGHFALVELEGMGVLKHTISQNIDNLHVIAGQRHLTEIHGNRTMLRCIDCGDRWPWDDVDLSSLPPVCACGGYIKSDTVMFGEPIPRAFLAESQRQAEIADVCLIVGTSATVYPAASIPEIVLERGGTLLEVNTEPTPFSPHCAAVLRGPSAELLPKLVEAIKSAR